MTDKILTAEEAASTYAHAKRLAILVEDDDVETYDATILACELVPKVVSLGRSHETLRAALIVALATVAERDARIAQVRPIGATERSERYESRIAKLRAIASEAIVHFDDAREYADARSQMVHGMRENVKRLRAALADDAKGGVT